MLTSYSSYFLWLILFLLFFALSKIADQMTVISLVGFIGNLLGAICFFIAKRLNKIRKSEED
jgi:nicotinamide riboside transporter PnuC